MTPITKNHNEEVRAHLLAEFGRFDECCGVVAPPWRASFVVEEPLQTDELGMGAGEIPPGVYVVDRKLNGGITSHSMILRNQTTNDILFIEVGYVDLPNDLSADTSNGHCIDWRGVKKIIPATPR